MRIALLAQDFPPRRGGTHAYNVEFATRLAQRGHDVRVLTWQEARDPAAEATFPFELRRRPHVRVRHGLDASGVRELLACGCHEGFGRPGAARATSRARPLHTARLFAEAEE